MAEQRYPWRAHASRVVLASTAVLAVALALPACGGAPDPAAPALADDAAAAPPDTATNAAPADASIEAAPDTRGELVIEMTWVARLVSGEEFKDLTTYDRRTRLVCPITVGGTSNVSSITGPTPEQIAAMERGDASVYSEGPALQPWFNEGCQVRMVVADTRKLDDPTIAGEEPTIRTAGTQEFETPDTLVTVETDLDAGSTRLLFVSPQGSGFRREAGYGQPEALETAAALPTATVIAGPYPGPLKSGEHSFDTAGGKVTIRWQFRAL